MLGSFKHLNRWASDDVSHEFIDLVSLHHGSHKNPAQQASGAGDLDTLRGVVENHGALDRPALQKWQADRIPTDWYSHYQCLMLAAPGGHTSVVRYLLLTSTP